MAALVAISGVRLGRVSGWAGRRGGRRRRAEGGRRLSAAQHRPTGARRSRVGGELGPLVVVDVEGVESLADGAAVPRTDRVVALEIEKYKLRHCKKEID